VEAGATTFTSSAELAAALRRAAAAHGEHEKRTGRHDADWPDWYAEHIVRERAGNRCRREHQPSGPDSCPGKHRPAGGCRGVVVR
jgi:hypothetical protein